MKRLLAVFVLIANGDIAHAETAFYKAGQAKSAVCAGCHGPDGNSMMPMFPKIAELDAGYISRQLQAFREGQRQDPVMAPMAAALSDEDIRDIAAFFSAQKRTLDIPAAPPEVVARGEVLFRGGEGVSVPACAGCHGARGDGMPQAGYPYLRGQHADYVAKQLRDFKSGARNTDAAKMMRTTAAQMTEEEINAVAQYICGLE
ncbi:MAG: cytochrome c4 [Gammaproteobacteria bacterium]|nr:cytochrome c4 [Gammaproteobacteria bacterium]